MAARPRNIVITGASSGIGEAFARHYAAADTRIGLIARRAEALQQLAATLPGETATYPLDVIDTGAQRAAAADFIARYGVPDLVIANAGISVGTLTEHVEDFEAFRRVMETNVLGLLATFQPYVQPMRAAGQGTLAGIASVAGFRGLPGAGAYSASKSAAMTYLESLRVELRASGVRVVTVCPGYIATPMTAVNRYPMPFLLPADEAARRMARVIAKGRRRAVVPWQMAVVGGLLRWLPGAIYDRAFVRAGRKPRGLDL